VKYRSTGVRVRYKDISKVCFSQDLMDTHTKKQPPSFREGGQQHRFLLSRREALSFPKRPYRSTFIDNYP